MKFLLILVFIVVFSYLAYKFVNKSLDKDSMLADFLQLKAKVLDSLKEMLEKSDKDSKTSDEDSNNDNK